MSVTARTGNPTSRSLVPRSLLPPCRLATNRRRAQTCGMHSITRTCTWTLYMYTYSTGLVHVHVHVSVHIMYWSDTALFRSVSWYMYFRSGSAFTITCGTPRAQPCVHCIEHGVKHGSHIAFCSNRCCSNVAKKASACLPGQEAEFTGGSTQICGFSRHAFHL